MNHGWMGEIGGRVDKWMRDRMGQLADGRMEGWGMEGWGGRNRSDVTAGASPVFSLKKRILTLWCSNHSEITSIVSFSLGNDKN